MIFWFGFGSYSSRLGTAMLRCPRCRTTTPHELRETGNRLSLFFIPVWKFAKRHVLICQECGAGQEVPQSTATAIRRGEQLPSKNPFDLR